ncbi:MAG: CDP-glycerol glycerophosphotransferase family protein [Clostridiales bacterium]|nr:CDP-glycerol glycerophosphotransferase family protein [Clostridiales bacterium]
MYKFKRLFVYIKVFFIMTAAKAVSFFVKSSKNYKDLWIVSERGIDARDNAYHFFKYLRANHPEINAVYIISNDSPDCKKVEPLGTVVEYGSFRHYLCFALAKVKVSTHIDGYSPDILFFHKFGKLFPDKSKKIFLQHGIIKDDLAFCHADQTNIDMFACSAVPEYEYIDKNFGYKPGVLKLTGLCRYDNLRKIEKPVHKILFMPTWRSALRTCNRHTFEQSEYFNKYNSFLNSKKLFNLLEEYDFELVFYPHFEVHRFLDCFSTGSDRVKIADFKNNDVQNLLINSDILITDYSSVFFDYAYMRKPMVFFQYDENGYHQGHYKKGYFDYSRDGFGDIADTEDRVVDSLSHIIQSNLNPDKIYLDRMNSFFKYDDTDNCKRNFEEICKLL